eukprot:2218558-Pyramimonas_sp.AAC.1
MRFVRVTVNGDEKKRHAAERARPPSAPSGDAAAPQQAPREFRLVQRGSPGPRLLLKRAGRAARKTGR